MDDARAARPAPTLPAFRELLWPGPLQWSLVVVIAVMLGLSLYVLGAWPAGVGVVGGLVAGVLALVQSSPAVVVEDGELRAGRAHIPLALLAGARVLDRVETRAELGPRLDARAHLCLRGGIPTAVRVEVVDAQDPTPYWVVSTRRPDDLVRALQG